MSSFNRKIEILKILNDNRRETISNLASEFGVSERTIRRDIEELSLKFPIYTLQGRYNGGVYVMDGVEIDKRFLSCK